MAQHNLHLLESTREWRDLVAPAAARTQLEALRDRLGGGRRKDSRGSLSAGYRALFAGPSGTGKTLAASLLGRATGQSVYRVEFAPTAKVEAALDEVVKSVGGKSWILFFDEADALFGGRSDVSDAHDRFANQGVSYLLDRVESYAGLVILSTNTSLDAALGKRFDTVVDFA